MHRYPAHHRPVSAIWAVCLVTVALTATGFGASAAAAAGSLFPQWPRDPQWQHYVLAPSTPDATPTRVLSTAGPVTGAETFARAGGGAVTLTMVNGRPPPTIVVDYGKDVGGVPYFVVRSETGSPVLHSSFSEGLPYLGAEGDGGPSMSSAGDSSRADNLTVKSRGRITTGLIQGGERYERIALTSGGSVTLSSVGIRFTAVRATAKDFKGWFDSSSNQLDRIWYQGAYTTQLDELPAATLPAAWTIAGDQLNANGGNIGILRQGRRWTDYAMSFGTQVMTGEVGWLVRAPTASSGYLFYLDADNDTEGAPNTLQEVALGPSEYSTIADVELPSPITPGSWHRIRTVVSGQEITTSIDGRQAARIDMGSLPPGASVYGAGTVGFVVPGTEASFRDLRVTSPEGTTLYASSFSQSSALNDFVGGEVASPDLLPVIMDGAKRDRVVWSGDLGVEGPNVFDTTAADRYVRDSLQLLGSYQSAGGESAGDVPPTVPLGTFPESGYPYSASYSMDEVTNIATYYLYTGDLGFVRTEWPMITREISYENSLVDQRGLLSTDATDGMDWDYYDGARGGEVTAYNDIFYETLEDAATMAQALGLSGQATTYRKEATSLRSSINRYLFDPSTGLYPVSDRQPGTVAQDANSLAVLFGVVTGARASAVTMSLERALPSTPYGPLPFSANTGYVAAVSPFVTNEELQALFATGQTHAALSLMERLWGYMDRPGPDYTAADWETIGTSGAPQFGGFTSLAHGWSSGATADLSTYVLGVEPVGAGYRQWLVQPHPGSLSWVEGDVPTPGGNISVRWAQDGTTRRFALQVAAPVATRGTISVPVPSSGAIVTIHRSVHQGSSPSTHSIRTALGATYLAVPASGGQTYVVDVQPR